MSDKREFLKALLTGNVKRANELFERLKLINKPDKWITAFEKHGIVKCQNKVFTETEFRTYIKLLRNEFNLRVTIFKTKERKR
ncbi:hypothetical protein ACFOG5_07780 [Pedobacter fastidiosus]|uniref:Uncharacterized protein n=1 Tax=Pedobacter fastidiosus TaxID=2765361 RepID=A0ABR7KPE2_9SPHI|nr:hypothetical protein [Pedobacter fastidiosus]MBC6109945.1 hypothetical protein [Pedobacter fastidiosus]